MRNSSMILASLALVAALGTGCVGSEEKLGRGLGNATEFTRMGDFQQSVESEGLFGGSVATGVVKGLDKTVERTGLGIFEIVTAPFPPYHPILTDYVSEKPGHIDGYIPTHYSDAIFDVDSQTGFSGGEVAPFIPGSQFTVFDN